MSQNTSIEWTGATWNPIRARLPEAITLQQIGGMKELDAGRWGYHCEHVSPGCVNCYAESMNKRTLPAWGTGLAFNVPNRSRVDIFLDEDELLKPLRWKKPQKIFPCSMTDLFAEFVSDEMIDRMFAVMALCPQHTFQVLTKRAERMREYFADADRRDTVEDAGGAIPSGACYANTQAGWPLPNVHLGVSVEDQQRADERIPHLLQTPAAVRWVSYEPALGPVDFTRLRPEGCSGWIDAVGKREHRGPSVFDVEVGLDWVVVGGESGAGARPFDIQWARDVIAQCKAAGVLMFMKQLGLYPVAGLRADAVGVHPTSKGAPSTARAWERGDYGARLKLKDRKGGDMSEWPEDVRVREMPEVQR